MLTTHAVTETVKDRERVRPVGANLRRKGLPDRLVMVKKTVKEMARIVAFGSTAPGLGFLIGFKLPLVFFRVIIKFHNQIKCMIAGANRHSWKG